MSFTIPNYTDLATVKSYMNIDPTDTSQDSLISLLITPTSRAINDYCRRQFYLTTETRVYDWQDPFRLWLDKDLYSLTSFNNGDGTTYDPSYFFLYPTNSNSYRWLDVNRSKGVVFNWAITPQQAISVTGQWGYLDRELGGITPPEINQAVNVWIKYLILEKDAGGILLQKGNNFEQEYANIHGLLRDAPGSVAILLAPYVYHEYSSVMTPSPTGF